MTVSLVEVSRTCAKALLMIMNALCVIIALTTFSFAIVDARLLKQYGEEHTAGTFVGDMIIIAVCVFLISIAIFGYIGAFKENVKMLYLYVGFLLILMILELLVAVFVTIQRYGLEFKVTEWLRDDFFSNVTDVQLSLKNNVWNEIQTKYECCGLNGPEDYPATHRPISISCCPRAFRARNDHAQNLLYQNCIESETYNKYGCEDEILSVIRADAEWLLGVSVISFWFETAGIFLSMWVANNLKHSVLLSNKCVKY